MKPQQLKVKYFSPEQAKYINPDLIDFVTLNNGSMVKLGDSQNYSQFCERKACQNPGVCNRCGKAKYMGQSNNFSGSSYVFRGGKKKVNEAGADGVGLEVSSEGIQTQNLQGQEGALLSDILTGGNYYGDDQNENQGEIPQDQGQGYYEGEPQGTSQQQYVPVPEQNQNPVGGYTEGYPDQNQYYPDTQEQPKGVKEEFVNPEIPNENYPPQEYPQNPKEEIPIQTPYIPIKPVSEQPVNPTKEPVIIPQPYPQPSQPEQQPMEQPFVPPKVIPASQAAKNNDPVKQPNTSTAAPKSFKQLFKEIKKEARQNLQNKNVFRARRKEVQSNICPKCHLPKEILCPDCKREDEEAKINSQRDTQKEDQELDNENPEQNDEDNNNQRFDNLTNLTPRRNNYQNEKRNPQRDDNKNNRRYNQGNDKDNNRRNNQGNERDNNRRNPQRDDNKNNRRNNYGNDKDNYNNRRNYQGNDNRRNSQGNDNRRNSQGNDKKRNDNRNLIGNGRRNENKNNLRGKSDNKYNSRTFEKRKEEHNMNMDNYRYYETNNTTNKNRRTITIVKRGDVVIANHD